MEQTDSLRLEMRLHVYKDPNASLPIQKGQSGNVSNDCIYLSDQGNRPSHPRDEKVYQSPTW